MSEQRFSSLPDEFIRQLLIESAPDYSTLELGRRYLDADGHFSVRLGEEYVATFPTEPRRPSYDPFSMADLARRAPSWEFAAAIPVAIGEPALGYPFVFEIHEWLDSTNALYAPLTEASAARLGAALAQVHAPAPDQAPLHPYAEVPLTWHTQPVIDLLDSVTTVRSARGARVNAEAALDAWHDAGPMKQPETSTWIHGALDPAVVMSVVGDFSGILHWREYGRGDRSIDLAMVAVAVERNNLGALLNGYGDHAWDAYGGIRATVIARALAMIRSQSAHVRNLGWTRLEEWDVVSHD